MFIFAALLLIVISILVFFAAIMLTNLINVLTDLVKVVRRALRSAWALIGFPVVTLVLACAWIFMHILLIFLYIAKLGDFDAKYNTFVASGGPGSIFLYYLLLIFLVMSMFFGIFLQLSVLQFLAGSLVA